MSDKAPKPQLHTVARNQIEHHLFTHHGYTDLKWINMQKRGQLVTDHLQIHLKHDQDDTLTHTHIATQRRAYSVTHIKKPR